MLLIFWKSVIFFDNWVRTFQVICVVANEQLGCCITRAPCHGDDAGMKLYRPPGTSPSPPRAGGKIGLFLRWPGQCVECHGIHYTGGAHHGQAGDMGTHGDTWHTEAECIITRGEGVRTHLLARLTRHFCRVSIVSTLGDIEWREMSEVSSVSYSALVVEYCIGCSGFM